MYIHIHIYIYNLIFIAVLGKDCKNQELNPHRTEDLMIENRIQSKSFKPVGFEPVPSSKIMVRT